MKEALVDTNVLVTVMIDDDRNRKNAFQDWSKIEKAMSR